jgi:hypothetical protein
MIGEGWVDLRKMHKGSKKMPITDEELGTLYPLKEAKQLLKCSRTYLYTLQNAGEIEMVRLKPTASTNWRRMTCVTDRSIQALLSKRTLQQ